MIALDTHVLLWWLLEPGRLSRRAAQAIADAPEVAVSSLVFWEIALLARKGKVTLGVPPARWTNDVLAIPRIRAIPLTPEITVAADALAMHPDPADRFIVATAIAQSVALVTKDGLIRRTRLVTTVW